MFDIADIYGDRKEGQDFLDNRDMANVNRLLLRTNHFISSSEELEQLALLRMLFHQLHAILSFVQK
jgi:hypothetical protein